MFQAIFNSLSGLFSFSGSLDTISNNVANMNTPGFKGSRALFRDIVGGGSGYGSEMSGTAMNLMPGSIQHTGNPGDVAINGAGYFIMRDDDGGLFYTRAGQFHFDSDGYLVGPTGTNKIAGIDAAGNLVDINLDSLRTLPPEATTTVNFAGNLSTSDSTWQVDNITVYDSEGKTHTLTVTFTNNGASLPNSWNVEVKDEDGNVVGNGQIRFGADGSPEATYNTIGVTLGSGASQNISLNFGAPGSFSGTTQFSGGTSNVGATVADGHDVIGLQSWSFDENGVLQLKYADGETKDGPQIALAWFADETGLQALSGGLFRAGQSSNPEFGRAGAGVFGKIEGGSLETSNVDLTQQFGEMIVIQRGYQASSHVLTVANQMLQQLYNNTRGG